MGTLKERLAADLKDAMKAKDRDRLDALRMLSTSIRNKEVEVGHQLSDEEVQGVAATEVKRRREAAEAYEKGGRDDLLEKERAEERVLQAYLPEQLGAEEVEALIDEAIQATGADGPEDLGKVMGYVMGKAKGKVDGGAVNERVRARLLK